MNTEQGKLSDSTLTWPYGEEGTCAGVEYTLQSSGTGKKTYRTIHIVDNDPSNNKFDNDPTFQIPWCEHDSSLPLLKP